MYIANKTTGPFYFYVKTHHVKYGMHLVFLILNTQLWSFITENVYILVEWGRLEWGRWYNYKKENLICSCTCIMLLHRLIMRSRMRDTVKLTVCVCVCVCVCLSVPAVTVQRLQCDEN